MTAIHDGDSPTEGVPGILGRALLDNVDVLWRVSDEFSVKTGGLVCQREYVERYYGPVREVLLVSPAGGRVLDAAVGWRAAARARTGLVGPYNRAVIALDAAVDAMIGDRLAPAPVAADLTARGRCGVATPQLWRSAGSINHCALPAGHLGWHRDDQGTEWTELLRGHTPEPDSDGKGTRDYWAAMARDRAAERDSARAERDELACVIAEIRDDLGEGSEGELATLAADVRTARENQLREGEYLRGHLDRVVGRTDRYHRTDRRGPAVTTERDARILAEHHEIAGGRVAEAARDAAPVPAEPATPAEAPDLDAIEADLYEASNVIDHPDAPYDWAALSAMRTAEKLLAEARRLRAEVERKDDELLDAKNELERWIVR